MKIATMPIEKLKPAIYNPRLDLKPGHPLYVKLKRSIEEFDCIEPLVWNKQTGNLVGGHQRLKILRERGDTEVQVSIVDLTPEREKLLNLALNKVQGDWDEAKLTAVLTGLNELPALDISLSGFDVEELKPLLASGEPEIEQDEVPEVQEEVRTKRGDIYQLGPHRVVCADNREGSINGPVITLLRELKRGPCKVLVWHKPWSMTHSGIGNGRHHWELIIARNIPKGAYLSTDVLVENTDRIPGLCDGHSCPKPVDLIAKLIIGLSPKGIIHDCFLGSGTTLIAAHQLNRICYGIEIEPRYVDVTVRRFANFVGADADEIFNAKVWDG